MVLSIASASAGSDSDLLSETVGVALLAELKLESFSELPAAGAFLSHDTIASARQQSRPNGSCPYSNRAFMLSIIRLRDFVRFSLQTASRFYRMPAPIASPRKPLRR